MKSDATWPPRAGTVLDGRYRLLEAIDAGGMGVILRAEHLELGHDVAVKLLKPDVAKDPTTFARFRREIDVAVGMKHPNIVRCYDSGDTPEGGLYLAMELLEGRSLGRLLKHEGALDLARAAELSRQLLEGLSVAHAEGIVHRDLKPGNLFLIEEAGGEALKILDFGLARSMWAEDVQITRTGMICGTPSYLAPELLLAPKPSMSIDVYACGLIMLEMVTGERAFGAGEVGEAFLRHLSLPARIPRRIWDTSYGRIVAACLRKHPDERPADARELLRQLVDALPVESIVLRRDEVPPARTGALDRSALLEMSQRASGLDILRHLPRPECYEPGGSSPPLLEQTQVLRDLTQATRPDMPPTRPLDRAEQPADHGAGLRPQEFEFIDEPSAPIELGEVPPRRSSGILAPPPRARMVEYRARTRYRGVFQVVGVIAAACIVAIAAGFVELPLPEPKPKPQPQRSVTLPKALTAPDNLYNPPPPRAEPDLGTTVRTPDLGVGRKQRPERVRAESDRSRPADKKQKVITNNQELFQTLSDTLKSAR